MGECRSFSSGAAGNQEVNARFHLPGNQIAQSVFVDRTILRERCDESGATSSQLHDLRITLIARACMGPLPAVLDNSDLALEFAPDAPEFEKSCLPSQPFGGAHRAFGISPARLGVVAQVDAIAGGVEN